MSGRELGDVALGLTRAWGMCGDVSPPSNNQKFSGKTQPPETFSCFYDMPLLVLNSASLARQGCQLYSSKVQPCRAKNDLCRVSSIHIKSRRAPDRAVGARNTNDVSGNGTGAEGFVFGSTKEPTEIHEQIACDASEHLRAARMPLVVHVVLILGRPPPSPPHTATIFMVFVSVPSRLLTDIHCSP